MLKESARKCCKDGKEPQYPVHIRVPSLGAQGESAELSEVVHVIKSVSTTLEAVEHDVLLDRNPRSSTSVAAIRVSPRSYHQIKGYLFQHLCVPKRLLLHFLP
jgi:hypothetical protein